MKNFKTAIDGTGTTPAPVRINYIYTLLHVEDLLEFNELASQVNDTTNDHIHFIKKGLLRYLPPINAFSK